MDGMNAAPSPKREPWPRRVIAFVCTHLETIEHVLIVLLVLAVALFAMVATGPATG